MLHGGLWIPAALLSEYILILRSVPGAAGVLGDKAVNGRTGSRETLKINVSVMCWGIRRKISRLRKTEREGGVGAASAQGSGRAPCRERGGSDRLSLVGIQGTNLQAEGKAGAQAREATATWCVWRWRFSRWEGGGQ